MILLALVKGHSQKKCLFQFVRLQINSLDQKQANFYSIAVLTLVAFLKLVDSSPELETIYGTYLRSNRTERPYRMK